MRSGRFVARTVTLSMLVSLIAGILVMSAGAEPVGSLDLTFDSDGMVTTGVGAAGDQAFAIAIQSDGKIVAAGFSNDPVTGDDFALMRYEADGSIDTTFGTGGETTTSFGPSLDRAYSVAIQSDGKIVAAGVSYNGGGTDSFADFALARYNTDGSLDTTFSTDGMLMTAFNVSTEWANTVAIQSDGKIVAAGLSRFDFGDFYDFAMVRYDADGTLDTTFDTDGRLTTDFAAGNDRITKIAIQSDGQIVAAGVSFQGANNDFALARYDDADGSLDLTFDGDGKQVTPIGFGNDDARALAIQNDGKIIAGGISFSGTSNDFALARYDSAGTLDPSFDTDGTLTTDFASGSDDARSIALQTDGKIVVGGIATSATDADFGIARYNTDGSLDSSLDGDGQILTAIGPGSDSAISIALQTDGKIVAGGFSNNGTNDDFAVTRYSTQGLTVTKDGTGSGTVTSDIPALDCGATCSDTFNEGVSVTLTATPDAGSVFSGWSGDCAGVGTCTLSMTQARAANATFNLTPAPPPMASKTLTVTRTGAGSGDVASNPGGVNCGPDCAQSYVTGTSVTLTATPAADSSFAGWSGDCSGMGTCTVTMNTDRSVTAAFAPRFDLTTATAGNGSGTVTSSETGADCGPGCETHTDGTSITLTASPETGSTFVSWVGCDSVDQMRCTVMMSQDRTVTATFEMDEVASDICGGEVVTIQVSGPGLVTYGTPEIDVIRGTEGDDVIYGLDLADVICGLGGDDQLYGGGGRDGGKWGDHLFGGSGSDRLAGDGGDDFLNGERGHDTLYGDVGNDSVRGGRGADTLFGNEGSDVLIGGRQSDSCNGGNGRGDAVRSCEVVSNIP